MRLAIALLLVGVSCSPADDLKDRIDPIANKLLANGENIGFVVGIHQDGKDHVYGYGKVALAGGKAEPAGDTIFEIGSITKTFTGVLLAEAVRRKEVSLSEPAQNYLPPDVVLPVVDDTPITLEHLATHRSGLPTIPLTLVLLAADAGNPYADFDRKKLQASFKSFKPDPPGAKARYSNLGAGLVGIALVHSAKARSYDALVRERIAVPLGLHDTAEALTGSQRARFARGYTDKGKPTGAWDFACLEACGGLRSTANDMLRYAAANLGESNAPIAAALAESHKLRADFQGEAVRIGLFWLQNVNAESTTLWHNGGTGGFRCMLAMNPNTKTAVVLLCANALSGIDKPSIEMLKTIDEIKR